MMLRFRFLIAALLSIYPTAGFGQTSIGQSGDQASTAQTLADQVDPNYKAIGKTPDSCKKFKSFLECLSDAPMTGKTGPDTGIQTLSKDSLNKTLKSIDKQKFMNYSTSTQ